MKYYLYTTPWMIHSDHERTFIATFETEEKLFYFVNSAAPDCRKYFVWEEK